MEGTGLADDGGGQSGSHSLGSPACRAWVGQVPAELTKLERDEHIAEWVRLTEEKQSAQLAPKGPVGHRPQDGINAAVRELGIDRTQAQRAVKVASITDEAKVAAREAGSRLAGGP